MFAFRGGAQADMTIKGTDHLVLLVSDIESGVRTWRDNLGLTLSHRVDLPEIGMAQAFFLLDDGTFIELIAPTVETSPLNAALESRGEGVHVAAMRVDDLVCAVSELKARAEFALSAKARNRCSFIRRLRMACSFSSGRVIGRIAGGVRRPKGGKSYVRGFGA